MSEQIYEQKHTALLIVDPYNDFMSKGGKLYDVTKPQAVGFYDNTHKLGPAVRKAGILVFIVPHHRARPTDFNNWLYVNPGWWRMGALNFLKVSLLKVLSSARAWYASPAYRDARVHRLKGAAYRCVLVEGI